jgi:hypothetical protein
VEVGEGGEARVVEGVRFVYLGEVVCEEGVLHRFEYKWDLMRKEHAEEMEI